MAEMVYDDQACPSRGPGLTHTVSGASGRCTSCDAPTAHRNRTDMGVLTLPAVAEGAVERAPVTSRDLACSCFACQHPDSTNAGVRVLHRRRHEDFVSYLGDRRAELVKRPSPREVRAMRFLEANAAPLAEEGS